MSDDNAFSQNEKLEGSELEGREALICWDDGVWYDAIIVCYYPRENEYKLVYRADDGIEVAKLRDRRWILAPKKRARQNRPVLDGAIIEFEYPSDGVRYKAMVYDYSHRGERLKIAYIDEHTTDNLKGGGWDFLTSSPCLEDAMSNVERTQEEGARAQRRERRERERREERDRSNALRGAGNTITKRRTGKARRRTRTTSKSSRTD